MDAPAPAVHYRSCNFCSGTSFRIFRRYQELFPAQIYGDAALSEPAAAAQLRLQYVECVQCGLVFINPLPHFADIDRRSFDGERNIVAWASLDYDAYEQDKRQTIGLFYDHYALDSFRRNNRLLDVSCGPGVSIQWLAEVKRWQALGIDPDRHAARVANSRYGVNVLTGLIDDVPADDESFDVVLMDNSLEHAFNPLGTLLDAFRLLRRGGGLLIIVPNCDGLSTRYFNANAYWGHWFFYRPRVLCNILWRVGYEVQRVDAVQHAINPLFAERNIDIDAYRDDLAVILEGPASVRERVNSTRCYADFFSMLATKPADAPVRSACDSALRRAAELSLVELPQVTLAPPDASSTRDLLVDVAIDPATTRISAGELRAPRVFGQTFFCRKNGLTRIDILTATYTKMIPSGRLKIRLRTSVSDASDLASSEVAASTIRDNSYVSLTFPPIWDSAGRSYYVCLETTDIPAGYAFTVWRSSSDIYPEGAFYVDGHPQGQDVCFRTYCAG